MVELGSHDRHALVADDDALIRLVVATALTSDGWTVREVADGHEVIDALNADDLTLCIMDKRMPGPSLEIRREALARLHPDAAVVILSGDAETSPDGAVHLTKPVELTELRDGIARALASRRSAPGRAER